MARVRPHAPSGTLPRHRRDPDSGRLVGCVAPAHLFFSEGRIAMAAIPFWPWFVDFMARSFIMTWLINRSGRSVLITSLFHLAMNVFGAVIGVISYPALAAVEIVVAIGLM